MCMSFCVCVCPCVITVTSHSKLKGIRGAPYSWQETYATHSKGSVRRKECVYVCVWESVLLPAPVCLRLCSHYTWTMQTPVVLVWLCVRSFISDVCFSCVFVCYHVYICRTCLCSVMQWWCSSEHAWRPAHLQVLSHIHTHTHRHTQTQCSCHLLLPPLTKKYHYCDGYKWDSYFSTIHVLASGVWFRLSSYYCPI